jgi:hypothetical protein
MTDVVSENLSTPPRTDTTAAPAGVVTGSVRTWLRLEGLAVLAAASSIYFGQHHSWLLFVALFLAPDVAFAAYALGPRVGAAVYNLLHSYISPLLLAGAVWLAGESLAVTLIWISHIGFDRLLGYGLKYPTGFGDTHLNRLRSARSQPRSTL